MQLESIVAALPTSGLTMAHLTRVAGQSDASRELCLVTAARGLSIHVPADQMAFFLALDRLHVATAGAAGGA